ncbi:Uncharacterised protein [Salmonella enterica subsp. enterica]|uniref:Uncharacterized protein n=1 Tax=Salmonella enterica I TaxID=59201 RepID=A0A379W3C9_SALET|nr:Uncharacterised protein [Salmonella enterica subsp. enterica]
MNHDSPQSGHSMLNTPSRLSFLDRYLTVWISPRWRWVLHWVRSSTVARCAQCALDRHDQRPDRHRPDPDDVPAAGQGALRDATRGLRRPARAVAVTGAKLDHRAGADVRAGGDFPTRPAGIHDRPDPDWTGTLHRYGACVEPVGAW